MDPLIKMPSIIAKYAKYDETILHTFIYFIY